MQVRLAVPVCRSLILRARFFCRLVVIHHAFVPSNNVDGVVFLLCVRCWMRVFVLDPGRCRCNLFTSCCGRAQLGRVDTVAIQGMGVFGKLLHVGRGCALTVMSLFGDCSMSSF